MHSGIIRGCAVICLLLSSAFELSAEPLTVGHVAPSFVLKKSDGKPVSLASHKGQVVLLNFWATWCAPCRVEMPWFEEFSKTYGNRGLYVLGVSLDDSGWKAVQPVISKLKVSYPVALGDGKITKSYAMGDLLPATFVIDRTGKIRSMKVGFGDKMEFEKTIKQLLDEK